MTLTKQKMIAEIGHRTQLKHRDVQLVLESLMSIWQEYLLEGERIELENFFVLEVRVVDRGQKSGKLSYRNSQRLAPRLIRRLSLRTSRRLKLLLNEVSASKG